MNSPAHDLDAEKRKRIANIKAALAMRGYVLLRLDDGCWQIQRWSLTTAPLADITAVEQFAARVGA